jgi:epoxyqueuosine reductase
MKTINDRLSNIANITPCCILAAVPIGDLYKREQSFFNSFLPYARTAITLLHHIETRKEWKWYAMDKGGEHSEADDHVRKLCDRIKKEIIHSGYKTEIIKYPGESGLQFRYVAQASNLGTIGINAFLFNPAWGPWVHLRVIATAAKLEIHPSILGNQVCNGCMLCVKECPAGAISKEAFSGVKCRSYRKIQGEYIPYGKQRELRYCERCILICPQGEKPRE